MKWCGLIASVLLLLSGCGKVGGNRASVAGTYLQESSVPRNSPLLTRIMLKEDGSFEMAGMVKLTGTYTVTGTELRLKLPAAPASPEAVAPSDLVATLQNGVIDLPSGLADVPASRFKRHEPSAPH